MTKKILPEKKVEIILWDWIIRHSKHVEKIYFNNSKNLIGLDNFKVKGKVKKIPDLLIKFNQGYGTEFIAVEVKDNSKNKNIRDSIKIIDYYINYITRNSKYIIENKEIKINHFVVASQGCIDGMIYNEKQNLIIKNHGWQTKYKQEPFFEYQRTRDFVRTLWASFKIIREKYNLKKNNSAPSIGIIIDELNEDSTVNFKPHLMIMRKATNSWRAAFTEI